MKTTSKRVALFDSYRGFLLVSMIMLHGLGTFYVFKFHTSILEYSTIGFIFLSGFIIGKFKVKNNTIRGIKLLLIFLILNILKWKLLNYPSANILTMLTVGSTLDSSFEILVPIAYLMILSNIILNLPYKRHIEFLLLAILLIIDLSTINSYNFTMLLIGILGTVMGRELDYQKRVTSFNNYSFSIIIFFLLIIYLLIYYWKLWFLHVIGIILQIITAYRFFYENDFSIRLAKLGQYSLFIYLTHLIILKFSVILIPSLLTGNMGIALLETLILIGFTVMLTFTVNFFRSEVKLVDTIYSTIFK